MKWLQFLRSSTSGFLLVEFIVASFVGLLMIGVIVAALTTNHLHFKTALSRLDLDQNLRSTLDLIGINIREAGENLPEMFPAIEVIDGENGGPDELVMRRNLKEEVLKLCNDIDSGSVNNAYFAVPGTTPGCIYGAHLNNFNAWKSYREAAGGELTVYIYDSVNKVGEFFNYDEEGDTGSYGYIKRASGTWKNSYAADVSTIYVLEEWRFKLGVKDEEAIALGEPNVEGILQIITNEDSDNPLSIIWGVNNFQTAIHLKDDTIKEKFSKNDDWTEIKSVEIFLNGENFTRLGKISNRISAKFSPRNVLSF
jgi:hypothetical protein